MRHSQHMNGLDLKLERTAQRIRVKELAQAMGVSQSRVSRIEAQDTVTEDMAVRYRAALRTCGTSRDAQSAA